MLLQFEKYQALGNDFIILDETHRVRQAQSVQLSINEEQCRLMCDRHFGVGADGILSLFRSEQHGAEVYMHVLNADGSVASMCGNGARCVAEWLKNKSGFSQLEGVIETDSGVKKFSHDGHDICLEMGAATLHGKQKFNIEGYDLEGILVNIGNEHLIIPQSFDYKTAERLAMNITQSFVGTGSPNIGFVSVGRGNELDLLVYERGAGFTLACGSGACAAVAACWSEKSISAADITVLQPGGKLKVLLREEAGRLMLSMSGAASRVFSGAIQI